MLYTLPASPAKPDGEPHAAYATPAHAFFTAFREGTAGVRFGFLAQDEGELARVAAAFRSAGARTETWCRERLGWTSQAGRELAQAFALAAGGWLLQGGADMDVLQRELGLAWRAFGESHLH
ncbi:MAG TPA: hypothetical protein VF006_19580 [Longimicrobium sp.]